MYGPTRLQTQKNTPLRSAVIQKGVVREREQILTVGHVQFDSSLETLPYCSITAAGILNRRCIRVSVIHS